jgi:hypothetical protein
MPQLDRYLAFSEIFRFAIFFTIVYFIVYYLLVLLIKGAQIRSALNQQMFDIALKAKQERSNFGTKVLSVLEIDLLSITELNKTLPNLLKLQKQSLEIKKLTNSLSKVNFTFVDQIQLQQLNILEQNKSLTESESLNIYENCLKLLRNGFGFNIKPTMVTPMLLEASNIHNKIKK